jgi:hypothetical protein
MKRALFSIAAAAVVCGSIGSPSEAAPMGPVLAPVAIGVNDAFPVYYFRGHHYRYYHNHHYYKHRYYRYGRYHYY